MTVLGKEPLRSLLRAKRQSLAAPRRREAATFAAAALGALAQNYRFILSYASFGDELNLWPLNHYLEEEGKLLLPAIVGGELKAYHVEECSNQLKKGAYGILEPDPLLCREAEQIDLILVPALAFDSQGRRLGYGKGYYDRFLSRNAFPAVGVGFCEQLQEEPLPFEGHDWPLMQLFLF